MSLNFLGLAAYYRTFIQGFAVFVGRTSTLNWTSECTQAIELL